MQSEGRGQLSPTPVGAAGKDTDMGPGSEASEGRAGNRWSDLQT